MTLDEAIEHAKEKSKEWRYSANFEHNRLMYQSCVKCAEEHEQLVEWLTQLKEYQQLEEQGRLIKLPCILGSDVYAITFDYEQERYDIRKTKIIEVNQNCNGWFFKSLISIPAFKINDFGKTVFLTKSEAEAKLEELGGEENETS